LVSNLFQATKPLSRVNKPTVYIYTMKPVNHRDIMFRNSLSNNTVAILKFYGMFMYSFSRLF